ncbi:unnamed protein product [Durusdinium trenchii]|uniref:Uncharacterized protein n=2 Tax=Durusdinium trenchii TaxID=1381693 RepID=A0ABP0SG46_9DINO
MALAADACHACRAGSEEAKVRPVELCSTDSGTSYSSATSGGSSERPTGAGLVDPRCTNLNFFHDFARIEEMIGKGSFTKRKELSSCCRGEGQVELHLWSGEGEKLVVVKRLPAERVRVNQGQPASEQELFQRSISRSSEDVLAEIGVFSYLGQCEKLPAYILEMLFALQMDQEVWLVLEHAEGGDLFNVISKRPPSKELLLLWAWQLLQAVAFLHQQGICHRDISLENILLSGGDIRLMDFGQAVQSSEAGQLLRYFWAIGKPYYRPPETYIPSSSTFEVMMPPGLSSGQVTLAKTPSQDFLCHVRVLDVETATAEPYGYTAPPVDVFETGVSILIMFFAAPPWRQARPNDTYFKWVQSNGLQALAKSWKKALPEPVGELLKRMLHLDAEQRPSAQECPGENYETRGLRMRWNKEKSFPF